MEHGNHSFHPSRTSPQVERQTHTWCPRRFPDSWKQHRRRKTKKGVVDLSHLFSDPSPNGAQLGPCESLLWPDCTLSPLSPKVESGPVGDPVVSDPMHPQRDTPVLRQDPNTVREEPTVLSTVSLATHDEFWPLANGLPRWPLLGNGSLRGSPTLPVGPVPRVYRSVPEYPEIPHDHPRMSAKTNEGVTSGAAHKSTHAD